MIKTIINSFFIAIISLSLISLSGCETDVDVNAPWQDITVVYGLLSANETTHFIKINKSFVGPADANEMAQIRDSSEYQNIVVKMQRYKNNVATSDVYVLKDTLISGKEPGIFYGPEQTLYYFNATLDPTSQYKLIAEINGGEKIVTSTTEIIANFMLMGSGIFASNGSKIQFYNGSEFTEAKYSLASVKNGVTYQLFLHFHYTDYYLDGAQDTTKSFTWKLPVTKAATAAGGVEIEWKLPGAEFFQHLTDNIPELQDNMDYRKVRKITFTMSVGGEELNTYLEVNQPATGLIQEKPEYTNIDGGIGIFSTRITVGNSLEHGLNTPTATYLYANLPLLGFCADNGTFACN